MNNRKLIGVCGVKIWEQNVMPFMDVLKREAENKGFNLVAFSGSTDSYIDTDEIIGEHQFIELVNYADICALIILTETVRNEGMIQRIVEIGHSKNIPVFSLDRKIDGCYGMVMNNEGCFEQIMRHVVNEHGCRRVNMIAGTKNNPFSDERVAIYRKVLEENGIPFEEERVGYGDFWQGPASDAMRRFLRSDLPFPQAVVCANDLMAHAAISVLNEHGYEVPKDVIVTGYDGTKTGERIYPAITTGAPDYDQMVKRFFEEMNKYLCTKKIEPCDIVVPVVLRHRESCGCQQNMITEKDSRISMLMDEIASEKRHMEAMQLMLGDAFGKRTIDGVLPAIRRGQGHMDVWFDFYRRICVKTEVAYSYEITEQYTEVIDVFEGSDGCVRDSGRQWKISGFQEYVDRILRDKALTDEKSRKISELQSYIDKALNEENANIVFIHPIISGQNVYGFTLEGFKEIEDWKIKQADEFAMFLSYVLHSAFHEFKSNQLNENLSKANQEIEKMSLCDVMTGIYNRRGFFQKTFEIIRNRKNEGKYLYLFMIDMDGLKYINDNFGHTEGDFAIITLGKVLAEMRDKTSVCARIGGDEFICAYVEDEKHNYTSEDFSEHMKKLISETEGVSEKPYPIGASVGMMCEIISKDLNLDAMINSADDKMYKHKMARKSCRDK